MRSGYFPINRRFHRERKRDRARESEIKREREREKEAMSICEMVKNMVTILSL